MEACTYVPGHMSGGRKRLSGVYLLPFSTYSFEAGSLSEPVLASLGWKPASSCNPVLSASELGLQVFAAYPACNVGAGI